MRSSRWIVLAVIFLFVIAVPIAAVAAEKEDPKKEVAEGAKLFKDKCQACHGPDGNASTTMAKKMNIRSFASADVQKQSKEEIVKIITDGKAKMMAYKSKLAKDQIDDLADYIKSLKK